MVQDAIDNLVQYVQGQIKTVEDCAAFADGSLCAFTKKQADDCANGVTSACKFVLDLANNCVNGVTPTCKAVLDCANTVPGTPCGDAVQTVEDCGNGTPAMPCNPDPQTEGPSLSGCVSACQTEHLREVAFIDGPELPQVYLVTCVVDLDGPGPVIGVPVLMLDPNGECPAAWPRDGEPLPLVPEDNAPVPDVRPGILAFEVGVCEITMTASLYGSELPGLNGFGVPCAVPVL